MSLTLEETKERLLRFYDPDDLLEALQISADEMLDRFEDKLHANAGHFYEEDLAGRGYDEALSIDNRNTRKSGTPVKQRTVSFTTHKTNTTL